MSVKKIIARPPSTLTRGFTIIELVKTGKQEDPKASAGESRPAAELHA